MSNRRLNSFILFCQANREIIKSSNPSLPNSDITSLLAEKWRNLDIEKKQQYIETARQLRMKSKLLEPKPVKKVKKQDQFKFSFRIDNKAHTKKSDASSYSYRVDNTYPEVPQAQPNINISPNYPIFEGPKSGYSTEENILSMSYFRQVYHKYLVGLYK